MVRTSFSDVIKVAQRRNDEIASAYKLASRRLLSRQLSSLAASAADQRAALGEELGHIVETVSEAVATMELALPENTVAAAQAAIPGQDDEKKLFAFFRDTEATEKELDIVLASQLASVDPDLASRFEAFAEQARKRAAMASDHLDLLCL
jgi:hypothetical protein